jgi:hypothetical protein
MQITYEVKNQYIRIDVYLFGCEQYIFLDEIWLLGNNKKKGGEGGGGGEGIIEWIWSLKTN